MATDLGHDHHSEAIYAALVKAANLNVTSSPIQLSAATQHLRLAAVLSDSSTSTTVGFITDSTDNLPTVLTAVIAVLLILTAGVLLIAGARSILVGNQWGKQMGITNSKPVLGGGVGGVLFGSVAVGASASLPSGFASFG
jgi:hypothetical protein